MHMYVYALHFALSFVAFVVCTAKTSCLHPSRRMKRKNKHADETFFLATRTNEKNKDHRYKYPPYAEKKSIARPAPSVMPLSLSPESVE